MQVRESENTRLLRIHKVCNKSPSLQEELLPLVGYFVDLKLLSKLAPFSGNGFQTSESVDQIESRLKSRTEFLQTKYEYYEVDAKEHFLEIFREGALDLLDKVSFCDNQQASLKLLSEAADYFWLINDFDLEEETRQYIEGIRGNQASKGMIRKNFTFHERLKRDKTTFSRMIGFIPSQKGEPSRNLRSRILCDIDGENLTAEHQASRKKVECLFRSVDI